MSKFDNVKGAVSVELEVYDSVQLFLLAGIVYVKFGKTSEALLAMEEMNGRCMSGQPKPLKVCVTCFVMHHSSYMICITCLIVDQLLLSILAKICQ